MKSARGLAHSKSFARARQRLGLRQSPQSPAALDFQLSFTLDFLHGRRMAEHRTPWPHAPTHLLGQRTTYFLTASTYLKAHHFRGADRLRVLHRGLLTVARDYGWRFEAWAVFSNHYHFVGHSPEKAPDASNLSDMLSVLHVKTAKWVTKLD